MTSKDIHELLKTAFPDLKVFDRGASEYVIWPTLEEVVAVIKEIGELKPALGSECEHFSLHLHSRVKWLFPNRFFGEVWGPDIHGQGNHGANISISEDRGIILHEPQNCGEWWVPDGDIVWQVRTA